jgi:hypothetical protein
MDCKNPDEIASLLARVIHPQNGSPQVVSLDARTWETVDWLVAEMGENLQQISDYCGEYLQSHPDKEFLDAFHHYIMWSAANAHAEIFGLANNNYRAIWNDWDAKQHPFDPYPGEEDAFISELVLKETVSRFDKHFVGHVNFNATEHPFPANENIRGREEVWDKLPHRNYRIALTTKFSFLPG